MNNTIVKNVIFECEYALEKELIASAVNFAPGKAHRFSRILNIIATVFAAVAVVLGFAAVLISRDTYGDTLDVGFYIALLIILLIGGILRTRGIQTAMQYGRLKKAADGGVLSAHCTFDEEMVTVRYSNGKSNAFTYSNFSGVSEDKENIYLVIGGASILPIPKSSFIYGDPRQLPVFIRSRLSGETPRVPLLGLKIALGVMTIILSFIMVGTFVSAVISYSGHRMYGGVALALWRVITRS